MNIEGKPKQQIIWRDITPNSLMRKQPIAKPTKLSATKKGLTSFVKSLHKKVFKLNKKKLIILGSIIVLIVAAGVSYYLLKPKQNNMTKDNQQTAFVVDKLESGTPKYSTLLPANKDINSLGGWKRVSPTNADPVYAYVDKIDGVPISVSEQPLPDKFKTNTADQIKELAQDFSATEKITVGEIIIYLGSSSDGPQSVIIDKGDLLILIKSESKIENSSWANYVSSLQ